MSSQQTNEPEDSTQEEFKDEPLQVEEEPEMPSSEIVPATEPQRQQLTLLRRSGDRSRSARGRSDRSVYSMASTAASGLFGTAYAGTSGSVDDGSLGYSMDETRWANQSLKSFRTFRSEDESAYPDTYFGAQPVPQAYPTIQRREPEPQPQVQEEEQQPPPEQDNASVYSSFFEAPIEYIFGGDEEDDVSTVGGWHNSGWGNDSFNYEATLPAPPQPNQRSTRGQRMIPTIMEETGDESTTGRSSQESSHYGDPAWQQKFDEYEYGRDQQLIRSSTDLASVEESEGMVAPHYARPAWQQNHDEYEYGRQQEFREVALSEASESQGRLGDYKPPPRSEDESLGLDSRGVLPSVVASGGVDQMASAPERIQRNFAERSISDLDAERIREGNENEQSITDEWENQSMASYLPRRHPREWSKEESFSVERTRNELNRRRPASDASSTMNESWRTTSDDRRSIYGDGDNRSFRSVRTFSTLPTQPKIISYGEGGPMMTEGMSGKAVVHVNLNHDGDGAIDKLDFATPLVDPEPVDGYEKDFDDFTFVSSNESTVVHGNQQRLPWIQYYMDRSKLVRLCFSRRCMRINMVLLAVASLMGAVAIAVGSAVESEIIAETSRRQQEINLGDVTPPPALESIVLPATIERNLEPWFHPDHDYKLHPDDVPFFWNIPLSGASVVTDIWGSCFGFTLGSDVGRIEVSDEILKSVQVYGQSYLNVDTTTVEGIAHAKKMRAVPSGIPDVIFSPLFEEAVGELYSRKYPTKLIITMRHPIERAVAMYMYLQSAPWDPTSEAVRAMSIEQYAQSDYLENNYVTRLLTGKKGGHLSEDDLNIAKEILRRKAVVGVFDEMPSTMEHLNKYFGWTPADKDAIECQAHIISDAQERLGVDELNEAAPTFAFIKAANNFDLKLFDYVHTFLFPYQQEIIARQTYFSSHLEQSEQETS